MSLSNQRDIDFLNSINSRSFLTSMNTTEYYKRFSGFLSPKDLHKLTVAVIGQGSGGGRVAEEFGRLGTGLILIDRPGECLEEHNIARHVLGYDSLGKLKVTEMARHIRNLNPSTRIQTHELDVAENPDALAELVKNTRPDLILACTDNQQSKYAVDAVARRFGIAVVGAGVYDGGVGGEVYVSSSDLPCYGCIAAQVEPDTRLSKKAKNLDYTNLDLNEIRSTCALNIDIAQITLIQSRTALGILKVLPSDNDWIRQGANLCVFANRVVPGVLSRPLHADFYAMPRRPDCLVCGETVEDVQSKYGELLRKLET